MTIDNAVCSLIGFWSSWKLTQISPNKSSLARPIFGWMDIWTSKIVEFETIPILARYTSSKCIPRKSLFGTDFGLAESSIRTSSKTKRALPITVNGERYRSMISNFLWYKMDDMDTDNMWFQQDGATCHTHATMDILHERFEGMIISRGGDVNCHRDAI